MRRCLSDFRCQTLLKRMLAAFECVLGARPPEHPYQPNKPRKGTRRLLTRRLNRSVAPERATSYHRHTISQKKCGHRRSTAFRTAELLRADGAAPVHVATAPRMGVPPAARHRPTHQTLDALDTPWRRVVRNARIQAV
jgi:hypothetical protein